MHQHHSKINLRNDVTDVLGLCQAICGDGSDITNMLGFPYLYIQIREILQHHWYHFWVLAGLWCTNDVSPIALLLLIQAETRAGRHSYEHTLKLHSRGGRIVAAPHHHLTFYLHRKYLYLSFAFFHFSFVYFYVTCISPKWGLKAALNIVLPSPIFS